MTSVNQIGKIGLLLLVCVATVAGFLWLTPAEGFPSPSLARIVVFHVPCSIVGSLVTAAGVWFALRYLRTRRLADDIRASVAFALATLLWSLTTVTGALFARAEWGTYWNWDPKQTCILMLLMVYVAYFVLRAALDDRRKRAAVSAAYTLFALVAVPVLTLVLPNSVPETQTLHPRNASFSVEYRIVLWAFTLGLALICLWAYRLHVSLEMMQMQLDTRARGVLRKRTPAAAPVVIVKARP